jgi:anti-sigma-K factor RskA
MARSISPDELQLLIAGYVLGDLDADEAAEFEQLLIQNPAIAQEVMQVQQTLEWVYAPPEIIPPPHLRTAIVNAHQAVEPDRLSGQARPQSVGSSHPWRFRWEQALGIAAAGLIVALGISNYHLWQTLQEIRTETQQFDLLTYSLQVIDAPEDASVSVTINPNTLEAQITVENLPPLPPDQVYALWTVLAPGTPFTVDDKGAFLTAFFNVDAQGNLTQTVNVPDIYRSRERIVDLAITIEDATSPEDHEGSPIMMTSATSLMDEPLWLISSGRDRQITLGQIMLETETLL